MAIESDCTIRKSENFVETVVDEELVLMHIVDGRFYALKDTGRHAWKLLDEHARFGDLVEAVRGDYDVSEATCREELGKLFDDLRERTLVSIDC